MNYAKFILIGIFVILVQNISASVRTVEGIIKNSNTYEEIANVNIYIQGQTFGTTSNQNGYYKLELNELNDDWIIIFDHIGFDTLSISLRKLLEKPDVFLQPKIMRISAIRIESEREQSSIAKDLPQPLTLIDERQFEIRGYTDAGDLLKTEQSIQIDEELSGRKTITMRAGNADDIIVLFNGIKMNNPYNNIFDLSLLNLDDVERIEIIKGSNTSLYGPDAFSGVINVVPKLFKNHMVMFQQRIGTYASGDWNLQLNYNFLNRLNLSYTHKQGASRREYEEAIGSNNYLENKILHHSASLTYNLSANPKSDLNRYFTVIYQNSDLDYQNLRDREKLTNLNQVLAVRYIGNFAFIKNLNLTTAYHQLDENQELTSAHYGYNRETNNQTINFNTEKLFKFRMVEYLFAYQHENTKLDFKDVRLNLDVLSEGVELAEYTQERRGVASILKFHAPAGSDFLKTMDVSLSHRYDNTINRQDKIRFREEDENSQPLKDKKWSVSTLKFSSQLKGNNKELQLNAYLNFGNNVKFPSIFQQLSTPLSHGRNSSFNEPKLEPERNTSLELGGDMVREVHSRRAMNGWGVSANYFKNEYQNKFRMYRLPTSPITFFDNVPDASISGFDIKTSVFLFRNKVTFEIGTSNYSVSDKSAFPFKYDHKHIINLFVDYYGYSFHLHWFNEGDQVGMFRDASGRFSELLLPAYSNIDLHLSKKFQVKIFKIFGNLSARNLFDDNTKIEGLTIRDRRYYITFGVQY